MCLKIKLKTIIVSFLMLASFSIISQNQFDKGYFLDNDKNKVECLIKNLDWKNNPEEFTYKLSELGEVKVANLISVSKFEIYEQVIYMRATVQTDINSSNANQLDYSEALDLIERTVFLKMLIGGEINLYLYKDANAKRFYYQEQGKNINILEYKEYINSDNKIAKNQNYKKQLYSIMKCNTMDVNAFNNADYEQSDLMTLVGDYNTCKNELSYTFTKKKRQNTFNVSIRPGLNFGKNKFDFRNDNFGIIRTIDFDRELTFRMGVEFEYVLPFNNNKWSLIIEPTYQYYKTEKTYNATPTSAIERTETSTVDYSSIELPFGFRHYSYLNQNSRLFFNVQAIFDIKLKSEIEYRNNTYESSTGGNLAFGLGYSYMNKYSIEARLFTGRELLNDFKTIDSQYTNLSLIFGYTIF